MTKPKEILSADEYRNYRNVRIALIVFIVFGVIISIASIQELFDPEWWSQSTLSKVVSGIVTFAGVASLVGGTAALFGNRRWAWVAYVAAVFYAPCIPIGTVLSIAIFGGLSQFLQSKHKLRYHSIVDNGHLPPRRCGV